MPRGFVLTQRLQTEVDVEQCRCLTGRILTFTASHGNSPGWLFLLAGIRTMKLNNANGNGVVLKRNISNYMVYTNGQVIECTLAARLRKELVYSADNPKTARRVKAVKGVEHSDLAAVGDQVEITTNGDGSGLIQAVLPRANCLTRRTAVPMPSAHPFEQVIAANVDQVVPVFAAAQPSPKWNLLDRYLVSAESLELPALICLTKLDLANGEVAGLEAITAEYQHIGYRSVFTSIVAGAGLQELKEALVGRVSVLVGKSGVGKTSLLNAIQPGLGLRVREVSQTTGKGRHTTSYVEMFLLEEGGAIIDTPGVREFGLWDLDVDDLAFFFPEMRPFIGKCKFGLGCSHDEEPGCAIRKAVSTGQVSPRRYRSYQHLIAEGYFYDQGY